MRRILGSGRSSRRPSRLLAILGGAFLIVLVLRETGLLVLNVYTLRSTARSEARVTTTRTAADHTTSDVDPSRASRAIGVTTTVDSIAAGAAASALRGLKFSGETSPGPMQLNVVLQRLDLNGPYWIPLYKQGGCDFAASYDLQAERLGALLDQKGEVKGRIDFIVTGACSTYEFRRIIGQGVSGEIEKQIRSMLGGKTVANPQTAFAQGIVDPSWGPAAARVAQSGKYGGLRLGPLPGLVALGPDPDSGLEEFAHLGSGTVPTRDPATKRLVYADDAVIVLVLIPGGTFWMGAQNVDESKPNYFRHGRESPVHEVTLSPFFLAKHECTQAQWAALTGGEKPSFFTAAARRPVDQVSWADCDMWLTVHGLTLPTEAQWEYACRAGTSTPWWSGPEEADLARVAWYDENADSPHPVGEKPANPFGLHDVHGNVLEWCRDGRRFYTADAVIDPVGEAEGCPVVRGGSFHDNEFNTCSANRGCLLPGIWYQHLGFRAAKPCATPKDPPH